MVVVCMCACLCMGGEGEGDKAISKLKGGGGGGGERMPDSVSVFALFGSNIDGSFTTAVSTFWSPLEKYNSCRLRMKFILIENNISLESPQ